MSYYLSVLSNYATFGGRARRAEYWYFCLVNTLLFIALAVLGMALHLPFLPGLYNLAVLLPGIGVGIRRMHDTGHSGWWLLLPIVNLVLVLTEGDRGSNAYGSDPKAGEELAR